MRIIVTKEGYYFTAQWVKSDELNKVGVILDKLRSRGKGRVDECAKCGGA